MSASQLNELLTNLDQMHVKYYLDGGWGVDALLGEQTREHKDADLIIYKADLEKVKNYLLSKGYKDGTEADIWWHFFMESPDSSIDFLVLTPGDDNDAYLGPRENNAYFPPEAFGGVGSIDGHSVSCLAPAYRVRALTKEFGVVVRNKYQISIQDCLDMVALCKKFSLEIPKDYTDYLDSKNIDY